MWACPVRVGSASGRSPFRTRSAREADVVDRAGGGGGRRRRLPVDAAGRRRRRRPRSRRGVPRRREADADGPLGRLLDRAADHPGRDQAGHLRASAEPDHLPRRQGAAARPPRAVPRPEGRGLAEGDGRRLLPRRRVTRRHLQGSRHPQRRSVPRRRRSRLDPDLDRPERVRGQDRERDLQHAREPARACPRTACTTSPCSAPPASWSCRSRDGRGVRPIVLRALPPPAGGEGRARLLPAAAGRRRRSPRRRPGHRRRRGVPGAAHAPGLRHPRRQPGAGLRAARALLLADSVEGRRRALGDGQVAAAARGHRRRRPQRRRPAEDAVDPGAAERRAGLRRRSRRPDPLLVGQRRLLARRRDRPRHHADALPAEARGGGRRRLLDGGDAGRVRAPPGGPAQDRLHRSRARPPPLGAARRRSRADHPRDDRPGPARRAVHDARGQRHPVHRLVARPEAGQRRVAAVPGGPAAPAAGRRGPHPRHRDVVRISAGVVRGRPGLERGAGPAGLPGLQPGLRNYSISATT